MGWDVLVLVADGARDFDRTYGRHPIYLVSLKD